MIKLFGLGSKQSAEYIIVGLGNPGIKYERSRHNAGFMAIDHLAMKMSAEIKRIKHHALVCRCVIGGKDVLLMKPQTYMNESGKAVVDAARFYKTKPENIIVLFDDISLDPGVIRIRAKGSAGGHNGIKSIIDYLGSENFPRIKIGVGAKPHPDMDLADWVLGKIPESDMKKIGSRFDDVSSAAELMVKGQILEAMNRFNGAGQ